MIDYLRTILVHQYEAALCMLHRCIDACPEDQWEAKVANGTVRWVAYHTLFFTDLYLSSEKEFQLRALHELGGDERLDEPAPGLHQADTLAYLAICREAMVASLARETDTSIAGPCGFPDRNLTRGELHIYNIRHVQHHAGQLSAFLRRIGAAKPHDEKVRWVGSGWRD